MSLAVPSVSGWQGIQNVSQINGEFGAAYAPRYARSAQERTIGQAMSRSGFRGVRRVIRTLNGAAPGTTATDTYQRAGTALQGPTAIGPGGARDIETVTTVNRATTAADQTYIQNLFIDSVFAQAPQSYPQDLSGNGGAYVRQGSAKW